MENLDELRLENEKLQFELQEIQLQATCYDLDADVSRLTTGEQISVRRTFVDIVFQPWHEHLKLCSTWQKEANW